MLFARLNAGLVDPLHPPPSGRQDGDVSLHGASGRPANGESAFRRELTSRGMRNRGRRGSVRELRNLIMRELSERI